MKIEIKYSTSEGPHLVEINHEEILEMKKSKKLSITQPTRKGHKTISIVGTKRERADLSDALKNAL